MGHIVETSNPFDPLNSTTHTIEEVLTIREWLRSRYGEDFKEFPRPTLCKFNGSACARAEWEMKKIGPKDVVEFVALPGDLVTALYIIVGVFLVASVVVALNLPKIQTATQQETPEGDPVFTLKGQRNQIRLSDPIEVPYGRNRIFPSYAAASYNQYIDNNQWLFQLLCIGQGEYDVESVQIEDTDIDDFPEVQYEVIPPGGSVTLFPDNVITAPEVGGIELFAPNEPASGLVWVEDTPGDPSADPPIDPTGHYATSAAGPYVANPANTQTNRIEIDLALTKGLYLANNQGGLDEKTVTVLAEKRPIDNAGNPTGDWSTLFTWTKTLATNTPQRFTISTDVDAGRYQVRVSRTDTKDTSARAGHTVAWEALRAFLPNTTDFGNVTLIAIKARASNNLNDNSSNRINVWATRKLPIPTLNTDGSISWSAPTATRSIAWAFCDVLRSLYGGRLGDSYIDVASLITLDTLWNDREEYFDWVFDQRITVWDALRTIARVGRGVPMLVGSRVTIIRDEPKSIPTAVFNQENIVKGSFSYDVKLWAADEYDGIEVEYTDPDTGKPETVPCVLDDEDGENLEKIKLEGCADRTQAFRWGMYYRGLKRYAREVVTFKTGMEGHIPTYGDLFQISHDSPKWATGGFVKEIVGTPTGAPTTIVLKLSEPVSFDGPSGTDFKIALRKNDGSRIGTLFSATPGENDHEVEITATDEDWEDFVFDGVHEKPLFLFGPSDDIGQYCILRNLTPNDDDTVELSGANYDARVFDFDEGTPPAPGNTHGSRPDHQSRPIVEGLTVVRENNVDSQVIAAWKPAIGAEYYVVQLSYDGKVWSSISDRVIDNTIKFSALPKFIYVRVAGVSDGRGNWAYWTGIAPLESNAITDGPTALLLTSGASTVLIQEDGTAVPRLKASWTASTDPMVEYAGFYRIQYKISTDSDWIEWGTVLSSQVFDFITDVRIGNAYDVRIRAETRFGAKSDWIVPGAGAHTVEGDQSAPAQLAAPVVTAYPGYLNIVWAKSVAADTFEYRVYRNAGSDNVSAAVAAGPIAETGDLEFNDPDVTPGTVYYYYVAAVDGSENVGTPSTEGHATAALAPVGATTPSNPSAASRVSAGSNDTYMAGDGSIFSFITMSVPALPANAVWQNLLYRRNGAGDWLVAAQLKNTGTATVRVDDLSPNVSYEFATQAWSGAGGSSVITASGSPYTAPNDNSAPAQLSAPTVAAFPGYMNIKWARSSALDVDEYRVYRNAGSDNVSAAVAAGYIAETRGLEFDDPNVTPGTVYYYYVAAVDRTENIGTPSTQGHATAAIAPVGATTPSNPSASAEKSPAAKGTYLSGDGTTYAYITLTILAMPANAVWQNVLYRKNGSDDWIIAAQLKNTGSTDVRIDDLSPGTSYDFATQAWSGAGGSAVVSAGTITAPNNANTPTAPSSVSLTTEDIPVAFYTSTGLRLFGSRVKWAYPSDKDLAYFELKVVTTNNDASTAYTWNQGQPIPIKLTTHTVVIYSFDAGPGFVFIRAVNRTGTPSAWVGAGNANGTCIISGGDMMEQDSNDVDISGGSMTGMTTIATSSARRLKRHIRTFRNALEVVAKLRAVTFLWRRKKEHLNGYKDFGFIAEEVNKVLPQAVHKNERGQCTSVDYSRIVSVAIQAIKEQDKQIKSLRKEVDQLKIRRR